MSEHALPPGAGAGHRRMTVQGAYACNCYISRQSCFRASFDAENEGGRRSEEQF